MPTISAGCLSILQLFVLSTTDIIINIAHEYILHISLQKNTIWCSLLFLSQDKKMNRQSTDFPLLSTVYKMYTYMHVLTSVSSYMALYYPVSIFSMVWIIMRTYLIINMNWNLNQIFATIYEKRFSQQASKLCLHGENIRKNNSIFQKMIIMIMKKFNVVCSILDN